MEKYHCPECKKAVKRDRIQTLPYVIWIAFYAYWPQPYPPNAVPISLALVAFSVFALHFYFKRHP